MSVLVTGCAGFIGFHLTKLLLQKGVDVVGVDNVNDYYDITLKNDRLKELHCENMTGRFLFHHLDLAGSEALSVLSTLSNIEIIVHLAAQAGVRYSLENPRAYVESNISGFTSILEFSRVIGVKHLVYASSSSVYGGNRNIPFHEEDRVDNPVSFYAVTKKSNELMAHCYSHLYGIPSTGLRFFTVYGPWGRPDMAPMIFTKAIFSGAPIKVFNHGDMLRDFTYIDDIVDGIIRVMERPPGYGESCQESSGSEGQSVNAPHRILNIGNNKPVKLLDFIRTLERIIGQKAKLQMEEMQPGDVKQTYADIDKIHKLCGFQPSIDLSEGLTCLVDWYRNYYKSY